MEIKVFGPGCANCSKTEKIIMDVLAEQGIAAKVEKVTDMLEIAGAGIMATPAVMIDGSLKSSGKVPSKDKVRSWLIKS